PSERLSWTAPSIRNSLRCPSDRGRRPPYFRITGRFAASTLVTFFGLDPLEVEVELAGAITSEDATGDAGPGGGGVMKPRSGFKKCGRFGKTVVRVVGDTPNHLASVAEYSSTAIFGIQRPYPAEPDGTASSGPLS